MIRRRASLMASRIAIVTSTAALLSALPAAAVQSQSGADRLSADRGAAQAPQYLPLQTVRDGYVRMPAALARRVAVHKRNVLLQELLVDIATQAGLGLSYGEDLVRAAQRVTLDLSATAADVLAAATAGTPWTVLVTAAGQVSVTRAERVVTGTVTGRVVDRATSQPLGGAQITVDGTTLGDVAGDDGQFHIAGVPAGQHMVTARRIGYQPRSATVMIVDDRAVNVTFELSRGAVSLSEVVVTATGAERQKEIGSSVSVIDMTSEQAPIANTQELLSGRVSGVTVLANSGQAGAGGSIRLRGVNSISQGNSPIIYVDGVRMSNAHTPVSVGGHGDVLPLNDIDMTDVERVEVVKGPAATTLYGTEASGGVIQIFTKHGHRGAAQWTADASTGVNTMGHVGVDSDPTGMFVNQCSGVLMIGDSTRFQDPTCPSSGSWLRNGPITRYSLGVRGAADAADYYISGNLNDEHSVLQVGENRFGGVRGNVTARATPALTLGLNTSFVKRDVRWYPDGLSSNAFLLNVSRGPGSLFRGGGCSDATVVCVLDDSIFTITNTTATNHFITGGTATFAPGDRFSLRLSGGYDYDVADITDITPFGHLRVPLGQIFETQWNRTLITYDIASTFRQPIGSSFAATTSIGGQAFDSRLNQTDLSASNFAGPGVPTLTSGALRNIVSVNDQRVINAGLYGQEVIAWRDRLFVTGGARVDGNSAFGSGFGLQTYPKLSVAYALSDESFWSPRWIETLKLRGAIGESGKAPGAFDAVRTWDPVAAENGQSAFEPSQVGNPTLGPERTREVEGGFDASAIGGRLSLSFSYYRARTSGALVPVTLPPSLGFSARQLENVGVLMNHGGEVSLTAELLTRRNAELTATLQYTSVRSEAGDLGGQTITVDANSLSFVQQGLPVPSYIGDRVTNPTAFADPVVEHSAFLGGTFPTSIVSPRATLRLWRRLSLDALGEFQRGGHLVNAIGFANEGLKTWQPCYDVQNKLRAAAAGNSAALDNVTALDRARCANDAKIRSAGFWVESSDFFKLRSISLAYDLPDRLLGSSQKTSISVSGRNLFKSTAYTGTDPESADQGVNTFSRRDYYIFPAPRTVLVTVRTGF